MRIRITSIISHLVNITIVTTCSGCSAPPQRDFPPLPPDLLTPSSEHLVFLLYKDDSGPKPINAKCYTFGVVKCAEGGTLQFHQSCAGSPFVLESFDLATLDQTSFSCPKEANLFPQCGMASCTPQAMTWACKVRDLNSCDDFRRGFNPFDPNPWEQSS